MTTEAKAQANRRNAQKSTGPRTDAGKAKSKMNALTHGLAARAVVLPGEDPAAFEARRRAWVDDFAPDGDAGPAASARRALAERAALATWRLDRCARREAAVIGRNVRHAIVDHERAQEDRAAALGKTLLWDPLNRTMTPEVKDPVVAEKLKAWRAIDHGAVARELESFAAGIEWMLARWGELDGILQREGYWHYPDKFAAIRLCGLRPENVLEDEFVGAVMLACNVAHPEAWALWDEFHQARLGCDGKPMYARRVESMRPYLPSTPEAARATLRTVIDEDVARLTKLKADLLDPIADLDRDGVMDAASIDDSEAGRLAQRYEAGYERELHRCIAGLLKLQKSAPPAGFAPAPAPGPAPLPEPSPAEGPPAAKVPDRRSMPRNEPTAAPSDDPDAPPAASEAAPREAPWRP